MSEAQGQTSWDVVFWSELRSALPEAARELLKQTGHQVYRRAGEYHISTSDPTIYRVKRGGHASLLKAAREALEALCVATEDAFDEVADLELQARMVSGNGPKNEPAGEQGGHDGGG